MGEIGVARLSKTEEDTVAAAAAAAAAATIAGFPSDSHALILREFIAVVGDVRGRTLGERELERDRERGEGSRKE